jgi:hypothetical protein
LVDGHHGGKLSRPRCVGSGTLHQPHGEVRPDLVGLDPIREDFIGKLVGCNVRTDSGVDPIEEQKDVVRDVRRPVPFFHVEDLPRMEEAIRCGSMGSMVK